MMTRICGSRHVAESGQSSAAIFAMLASFPQSSPHPVGAKFHSWVTGMTSRLEKHEGAHHLVFGLTGPAVELYEADSADARVAKISGEVKQQTFRVVLHPVHDCCEIALRVDLTKGADVLRQHFVSKYFSDSRVASHAYDARDDRSGSWRQAAHGGTRNAGAELA
jgi:hypothetical protein